MAIVEEVGEARREGVCDPIGEYELGEEVSKVEEVGDGVRMFFTLEVVVLLGPKLLSTTETQTKPYYLSE